MELDGGAWPLLALTAVSFSLGVAEYRSYRGAATIWRIGWGLSALPASSWC